MGVEYSYSSVVGIHLTTDELLGNPKKEYHEEPSCGHSAEERAGKHCGACGKKVGVSRYEVQSDAEEALISYMGAQKNVVELINTWTGRKGDKGGFLIGRVIRMGPDDEENPLKSLEINPTIIEQIMMEIRDVLNGLPTKIDHSHIGSERIRVYMNMNLF